ncbi:MAG: metallophosphoesterase [Halothiobacillus sp.]
MSSDVFFEQLGRFQSSRPNDYPSWDMAATRGPAVLRLPANTKGRDFFVGDLHGMYLMLEERLEMLFFDPEVDRLVSVGDLIDRGPDNIMALDYLDKPWFFAVLGNHDHMMLDAETDDFARNIWMGYNGGEWARFADVRLLRSLRVKLEALPYVIEIEQPNGNGGVVGIVHAEVPIGLGWQGFTERLEAERAGRLPQVAIRSATWGRERFWEKTDLPEIEGVDYVISGHTTVNDVRRSGNTFYIDTGACKPYGVMTVATLDKLKSK